MTIVISVAAIEQTLLNIPLIFYFIGGLAVIVTGILELSTTIFPTIKAKVGKREHLIIDQPLKFFSSIFVIILAIGSLSFAYVKAGNATNIFYYGGGGTNVYPCPSPWSNLSCFDAKNNSTGLICTSLSCPTPFIQKGTASCTIPANGGACTTTTITFTKSYTSNPSISINTTLNPQTPSRNVNVAGASVTNLITFQTPGNSTLLFQNDETPVTITIPGADTPVKQYSPGFTEPWPNVLVEGEGYITTTATSTKQIISVMVEDCTLGVVIETVQFETESIAVGVTPFAVKGLVPNNNFSPCWSINVAASAADANTHITVDSLRLYGQEQGFRTWLNMPNTLTEIYGSTNLEQQFDVVQANGIIMNFCVNLATPSGSTTAYLSPYTDVGELSPTLRVAVDNSITPGLHCVLANLNLPASGFHTFKIMGNLGNGVNDAPAFGAISLSWGQTNSAITITVPISPLPLLILGETPTSFTIQIRFPAVISASNTITFNWQSIGT